MSRGESFGVAEAGGAVEEAQVAAQSVPYESKIDVIPPATPPFVKTRKKGSIIKRPRKKYEPVFRVNLLALIALILGILSLTMVWVQEGSGSHPDNYGLGHYADDRDLRFGLGIGLFVAGTLLVMIIRLFGIAQLAGILLFFVALADDFSPHTLGHVLGVAHTGFYLGLVAGILGTASVLMKYSVPVSERVLTSVPSRFGGTTRVNLLSLAAGVLGIVCFFMPWIVGNVGWPYYPVMEWNYDYSLFSWISAIASSLFLFGSVANLISPLGGFFQAAGVVFFFEDMLAEFRDFYDPYSHYGTIHVGFGLWVGVIASAIAIISLFYTRRLLIQQYLL